MAHEVVCEDLVPRVVFIDAVAFGVPDDVLIDKIRYRRGLDKDAAVLGATSQDDILAAARTTVVPIHPDAGSVLRVGNQVPADETAHVAVRLDPPGFPQQLGIVPGIAHHDVILDQQAKLAPASTTQAHRCRRCRSP